MTDREKPMILLVEDDEALAQLNARLLKRAGYDARVALTAAAARAFVAETAPDMFILDVDLPDGDGFELCTELRRQTDAPVVFMTGKSKIEHRMKGLEVHGDYYISKPFDRQELLAVVRSLFNRSRRGESGAVALGSLTLNHAEGKAYVNGTDAKLTYKEFAVLAMLAQRPNTEFAYEAIYREIWGAEMYGDSSALRQTVSRMRRKLGEDADDFDIFNERGTGYTFVLYEEKM